MSFKLTVGNVVEVPVKFDVQDGGRTVAHKFTLVCNRESQDRLDALPGSGTKASDFMLEVATAWRDQRILLGDDGKVADFSTEALEALFGLLPGVAMAAFNSYLANVGAKEKN